jgi:hypothetical protein
MHESVVSEAHLLKLTMLKTINTGKFMGKKILIQRAEAEFENF